MARATLVVAIVATLCVQYSWAAQYEVGGSNGWDASTDLNTWVSGQNFTVGDTLVFKYSSLHSVVEVNKAGYDGCSATNAVQTYSDGNTNITLSKAVKRYFICGTPGHCSGGMKLEVNALASLATAPTVAPGVAPAKAPVAKASSPAHAPGLTTIPAAATPSDGAPAASATRQTTPSKNAVPVASPTATNGATGAAENTFVNSLVALAGAAFFATTML